MTDINDIIAEAKKTLAEVNQKQEALFAAKPEDAAEYIVHGTHLAPERFLSEAAGKSFAPVFPKETQNELNALKEISQRHPEMNELGHEKLQEALEIPPRLFGIPTKRNNDGSAVRDSGLSPVPQDGSYAYAIKKCAGVICFTDDGTPLLLGLEEKYKKFEDGENKGHIYVVKGEKFRPEYDIPGWLRNILPKKNPNW